MSKIAESIAAVLKSVKDFSVPKVSRVEHIVELFTSIDTLDKNETLDVIKKFHKLCASRPEFVAKLTGVYAELAAEIDPTVRNEYFQKVLSFRDKYLENPNNDNRKHLKEKAYAVLAITTDEDLVAIVEAERKAWALFAEYVK